MKNKRFISIFTILLITLSCSQQKKKSEKKHSENEISQTWDDFLKIISSNDKIKFKEISNTSIRCYLCLENTSSEQEELEILRKTDSLWYDKIYDDKIYIPIDSFIANEFDLIFNSEFVAILKTKTTKFHKREIDGIEYYEILVTTTDPTITHEGGQHSFQFKKVSKKWKFNDIGTIP
ncbi:hypothetical protein [Aquimarina longa]|uniref:hypothetical protein n=1 Tax=Aquimarina longa TaxID=1080221 RepID=UPI000781A912|nr:hypothetical protein [Aquimarina longa]